MARINLEQAGGKNVLTFLDLLAWSEGTSTIKASDDGYNVLYGGGLFQGYADHPRRKLTFPINGKLVTSTAAGRYQFLAGTWDEVVSKYGFHGRFTPEAQDLAAIKKLGERGALQLIKDGRISEAIAKCSKEWASFPGNTYGQNPHRLEKLLGKWVEMGGALA
ncbi:glycoside hydrolase family 104 protein [Pseudomonas sp. S60]|uniref:glycoside hydrolase family 24 protein n=1 Tax=Pseudomonas sp. S60 TaxID=211124 RepID=UPI0019122059|nr:glycoside hydrolase family 104 protein [Pseudomonas sp. S60]MBK5008375.1 glycoside hydrolase family 104 protein [Pseudomonas sp. S60]